MKNLEEIQIPSVRGIQLLLEPIVVKLQNLENELQKLPKKVQPSKYYRAKDLKELFGLTNNTIIKYRNDGILPYTLLGGVYLYDAKAIDEMLEQNKSNSGRRLFYERSN
ncbi:helix-turn-helix domain-containing protein [Flavobacterium sp.]|jgi:hypothetical protein|uniref:helix-turn-helix domain-containing protein n=1 Tax=Flavobacterium sp. TaxID=239 RepID=UPI0037BF46F8